MRHPARTIGTALVAAALGALPLAASAQADYGSADDATTTMSAPAMQSSDLGSMAIPASNVHVMPVDVADVPLDATFVDSGTLDQATVITLPRSGGAPQASTLSEYLSQHGIDPGAVVAVSVNNTTADVDSDNDADEATVPSQLADVTVYVDSALTGSTSSS